jgi:hypothetical protein
MVSRQILAVYFELNLCYNRFNLEEAGMPVNESLVVRTLCEVVDVDEAQVHIRVRNKSGQILQLSYDLSFCPEPARVAGGSFWIEIYKKSSGETRLLTVPVNEEEDQKALAALLAPYQNADTNRNQS